ncbi:MAG: hypothetical protein J6D53_11935 [Blautia sp.]|nr:hypothetical protein [Blautia sp.]
MKKVSLEELLEKRERDSYESQYRYVMELIDTGKIKPVKSSAGNGRKPALHTQYWLVEEKPDYSAWEEELLYRTDTHINVDYYLRHLDMYDKDRAYVRRLSDYLRDQNGLISVPISRNERSFEIWGEEKFLSGGAGRTILSRCKIEEAVLNVYSTAEPFAYFAAHRDVPQKILILENKDPFFGMRRYLLERNKRILGEKIGTLIYGAGKRVVSSFREFAISAEPYMKESGNELLYFGDLDYEGIVIYETLVQTFAPSGMIRPFVPAYLAMLNKGDSVKSLPLSKEHQNKNITGIFFTFFDEQTAGRMKKILESGRYIPQEILNTDDYRGVPCNTNS